MKENCDHCQHFKDNHFYGERTDDVDEIGSCLERNCDCDKYELTKTEEKSSPE